MRSATIHKSLDKQKSEQNDKKSKSNDDKDGKSDHNDDELNNLFHPDSLLEDKVSYVKQDSNIILK